MSLLLLKTVLSVGLCFIGEIAIRRGDTDLLWTKGEGEVRERGESVMGLVSGARLLPLGVGDLHLLLLSRLTGASVFMAIIVSDGSWFLVFIIILSILYY